MKRGPNEPDGDGNLALPEQNDLLARPWSWPHNAIRDWVCWRAVFLDNSVNAPMGSLLLRFSFLALTACALLISATSTLQAGTPSRINDAMGVRRSLRLPTFQLDHPLLKPWPLLRGFDNPSTEALPDSARFLSGPWGMARWQRPDWKSLQLDTYVTSLIPWTEPLTGDWRNWATPRGETDERLSQVLWTPTGEHPAFPPDLSVFGSWLVTPTTCLRRPISGSH